MPLLAPPSLKNTMSPGRRSDLATLRARPYFHCPPSLMESLWPNLAQAFLVRHVQLIRLRLQVAYPYLVPMCLLAARTTALPDARARAVARGSSSSAAVGGVSSTSEGSSGPALPSVTEPCDGPKPSADETAGCSCEAAVAESPPSGAVPSDCGGSSDTYCSCEAAVWAFAESAANETTTEANTNPHTTTMIGRMIPLQGNRSRRPPL